MSHHPAIPDASAAAPQALGRVYDAISAWASQAPNRVALVAPGQRPLTYGELGDQIQRIVQALNSFGIGRRDRVAVVLPTGPDLAVAVLSIASGAACAPVHPGSTARELDACFAELEPDAVVLGEETSRVAKEAAAALGLRTIALRRTSSGVAGRFTLTADSRAVPRDRGLAGAGDVGLVLPTSGTTSRPRLVPLTHANLMAGAAAIGAALRLAPEDRCLSVMPLFHVHGIVAGLLAPLLTGGSVACPSGFVAPRFFEWIDALEPTWFTAVPTMHQAILAHAGPHADLIGRSRLRFIRSCSSALAPALHAELERVFGVPVVEAYGMTEAAHQITSNPLPPGPRKPGSVGRPAGAEVMVIGPAGERLPTGSPGEVLIRGAGVMRGYLREDGEAGAQTFRDGWLRTGDLGYVDGDGFLFITGRAREIINRAGEKISPREIEDVLVEHPAISQAAVFPLADPRLGEDVAAAVVPRPGTAPTVEELRRFVAARLPIHKVPRRIRVLDRIPTGATGKIQRHGLAERLGLAPTPAPGAPRPSTPPRTPTERALAVAWREVLGADDVGVDDDFLDLGGDSILAAALAVRIRELLQKDLALVDLFDAPTIADQARLIESSRRAATAPVARRARDLHPPLSHAQERLWFLQQLEPGSTASNRAWARRLTGSLDVRALEASLAEIVRRHETLRARFATVDGRPVQSIAPATTLALPVDDLRGIGAGRREARAAELAAAEAGAPFDLSRGPLFRARLLCLGDAEHVLVLSAHHIAFDAWSEGVFWRELAGLYPAFAAGRPSPLTEPAVPYSDVAAWQRDHLEGRVLDGLLAYWTRALHGAPDTLALPFEESGAGAASAARGHSLSPEMSRALSALARREHATVFMLLMAAVQLLLGRWTRQEDVVVGFPVSGRDRIETRPLIGLFLNMLPLRVDLSGNPSFRALLARVRAACRDAYAHQDLPFETLVAALRPGRSVNATPLFNVVVNQRPACDPEPIAGLDVQRFELPELDAGYALTLYVFERGEEIEVRAVSRQALLSEGWLGAMLGQLEYLLGQVIDDPDTPIAAYSLVSADARRVLPDPARPLPEPLYPMATELFEEHARRSPTAPAVTQAGRRWSYGELLSASDEVVAALHTRGLCRGDVVALSGPRSFGLVAGLLSVLRSGGVLLAIDPDLPPRRQRLMLEDAQAKRLIAVGDAVPPEMATWPPGSLLVLGEQDGRPRGRGTGESPVPLSPPALSPPASNDPAYIFFTSGTTGRPRGVLGRHKGINQFLAWQRSAFEVGPADRVAQLTSLSFDPVLRDVLLPLTSGAAIALPDPGLSPAADGVPAWLDREGVTIAHVVPSVAESWLSTAPPGIAPGALRAVFFAGEALRGSVVRRWRERFGSRAEIVNLYGPTETTMVKCFARVPADAPAGVQPIGGPLPDTQVLILGADGRRCGIGEPGEIVLRTPFRTLGYLDPGDTATRFRPNPWSSDPDDLLYWTGDAGRYRLDGAVDFLGRLDQEVKVRGVRIHPSEVTAALSRHPAVSAAAVVAHAEGDGGHRLTAYVVTRGEPIAAENLRAHLALELPAAMIPSGFVFLKALPLMPNGKVDVAALPPPERGEPVAAVAAQDELEADIAGIWAELLKVPRVGRDDDFFDLGGHSLLALRLIASIEQATGRTLPVLALFQAPTVARLARLIREGDAGQGRSTMIPVQPHGTRLPIYWVQPLGPHEPSFLFWRSHRVLAGHLGPDQPSYALQVSPVPDEEPLLLHRAESIARRCLPDLIAFQPDGPFILGGLSFGGVIAWELAQQLLAKGRRVELLILLDSLRPGAPTGTLRRLYRYSQRFAFHVGNLARLTLGGKARYVAEHAAILAARAADRLRRRRNGGSGPKGPASPTRYAVRPFPGRVLLLRARHQPWGRRLPGLGWEGLTTGGLEIREIPGGHLTMMTEPNVRVLAGHIDEYLARLRAESSGA